MTTSAPEEGAARALAEFAVGLELDDIPPPVLDHARSLLVDTVGCAVLGTTSEAVRTLATVVARTEQGPAAIWGRDQQVAPASAALVNGTAIHAFELDDIATGQHHGSVVLPAAMAIADLGGGLAGTDLLRAVVAGCEVSSRVQRALGRRPHAEIGFHGPSLVGTFGAVTAAAVALGLDGARAADAIGLAGQLTGGLMFTHHGGMGKRLLAGRAAQSGTLAALFAGGGFTSASGALDTGYGSVLTAFSGGQDPHDAGQLTADLGTRWDTQETRFKFWACRYPIHPTLEGIAALVREEGLRPDQVASITVQLDPAARRAVDFPWRAGGPQSTAQMNLRYCVAVALLHGQVMRSQLGPAVRSDPQVAALAARVHVEDAPAGTRPFSRHTPLRVQRHDGTVLTTTGTARGHGPDPVPASAVIDKFVTLLADAGVAGAAQPLLGLLADVDRLDDVRAITRCIDHHLAGQEH